MMWERIISSRSLQNILVGISSGPVALYGFSPARRLQTPLTVILIYDIVGYGLGPNLGRGS